MNVKKFLPLIAAAGLGLVALLVAHSGLGRGGEKGGKSVKVIVAKENIAPGQPLTADNVSEQTLSGSEVPASAFTSINEVINRVTRAPMVAGQPVLQAFLAEPGALSGLPALIPPGMRAVTIDVNETTGVAGLLQPGSHVDLVSVLNQGEHEKSCARTIASNVPVVAVGQRMGATKAEGDNGVYRTVTLLCKPKEVELIKLACLSANTSLVLRGNNDNGPADSKGVMYTELTSGMPMMNHDRSTVIADNGGPGTLIKPLSPGPTTRSADQSTADSAPPMHMRHITLYQGGVVSTVSYEVPGADNTDPSNDIDDYTGTKQDQDYQRH